MSHLTVGDGLLALAVAVVIAVEDICKMLRRRDTEGERRG